MPSRRIEDLTPIMQSRVNRWLVLAKDAGLSPLITCTYRTVDEQAQLYKIGRTIQGDGPTAARPLGRIITNARAGESAHNYRMALDFVPLVFGKPQWSDKHPHWQTLGELAERANLEWAGRWTRFRETAHLQMPEWRSER